MILDFDKPKKARSTEEHNEIYSADCPAAGIYVPNMSDADMLKWKAKVIGGKDPRVEIRKSVRGVDPTLIREDNFSIYNGHCSAQVLIIVRPNKVIMSSNGRMVFDGKVWEELSKAVEEARKALKTKA